MPLPLIIGVASLVASLGSSVFGYFKSKKAEKATKDAAERNYQATLAYQNDLYEQRVEEIELYDTNAKTELASQETYLSATGVQSDTGSALLTQVQGEINANKDIGALTRSAEREARNILKQAEVTRQNQIQSAEAIGSQATANLIGAGAEAFTSALGSGSLALGDQDGFLGWNAKRFQSGIDSATGVIANNALKGNLNLNTTFGFNTGGGSTSGSNGLDSMFTFDWGGK